MTYWPISSPSVFAATKHTIAERLQTSHDGVEAPNPEPLRDTAADDSTQGSGAESEEQTEGDNSPIQRDSRVDNGAGGRRPQHPRSPQPPSEDDIAGEIIAIKVTRSGHMFATITKTTLTIWQTKARILPRGR